jgi:hypothetical protein
MKNFTKMFLVVVMIIAAFGIAPQAQSQTLLLTESFENNGIIPPGWGSVIVTGSDKGMAFVTSRIIGDPANEVYPYDGSYEVFYNSYSIVYGSTRLYRMVGISTVGYPGVSVDFAMYHDLGYASNTNEGITPQYSIDGGATWNLAGSLISRYDGSEGWKIHTLALPANAGGQPNLRIAFLFTSQNGNNCFMDFVHLYGFTTSILQGTVTDCGSGSPLSGATVSCGGQDVTTGEGGTYMISGIVPGTYTATCTFSPPYFPATAQVTINENQMTVQNFCLSPGAPLYINAGENQVVYYGYQPAACAILSWSGESGGTPPYAIHWNTGETTQSITVCPTVTTVYTVTITDANNNTFSDDVKVCVVDVRCGNKLDKVQICHNGHDQCIAKPAVPALLKQGALLGYCGTDRTCTDSKSGIINSGENAVVTNDGTMTLDAFPNPFSANASITFTCPEEGSVTAKLIDHYGKETALLFDNKVEKEVLYSVEIDGSKLSPGLYFCVLQHSDGTMKIKKLLFTK